MIVDCEPPSLPDVNWKGGKLFKLGLLSRISFFFEKETLVKVVNLWTQPWSIRNWRKRRPAIWRTSIWTIRTLPKSWVPTIKVQSATMHCYVGYTQKPAGHAKRFALHSSIEAMPMMLLYSEISSARSHTNQSRSVTLLNFVVISSIYWLLTSPLIKIRTPFSPWHIY